jgi:hypothetical protein
MMRLETVVISLFVSACALGSEFFGVPTDIAAEAKEFGCNPPTGFYDRPGYVGPAYAAHRTRYGALSGLFAVVCEDESNDGFFILFVSFSWQESSLDSIDSCGRRIEMRYLPGGLEFLAQPQRLVAFVGRDDPRVQGNPEMRTDGPVLWETYDGEGSMLYCDSGNWRRYYPH